MNSSSGLISNRRLYLNIQLSAATSLESFKQEFPDPKFENFSDLVNTLVINLSRNIKELERDLNQEDLAILNEDEEYNLLKSKLEYSLTRKSMFQQEITMQNENIHTNVRNIIFAKSNADNIFVVEDISNIKSEFNVDVIGALERLKKPYNADEADITKEKAFNNNNKVKGVKETKQGIARIYYVILDEDTILAFNAQIKKSDNPSKTKQAIVKRKQNISEQIDYYKQELKDPTKKEKIIQENNKIYDELIAKLQKERRQRWK